MNKLKAISLFAGIGVGEFYLDEIGINVIAANEVEEKRCKIYKYFYPKTTVVCGDIRNQLIKEQIVSLALENNVEILIATPPCQGMSTVGKNKSDKKLHSDDRNLLILETFEIIDRISPKYVLIENVPRFLKVRYSFEGLDLTIMDILKLKYGKAYQIEADIFDTANFGIPQVRTRAFIRLYKKGLHWPQPKVEKEQITVEAAIGHLPSLESAMVSDIKNHWARKHPDNQIEWMKSTPTGQTAFNNKIKFPVNKEGNRIKGFKNCYRRIDWHKPAPTITMRNEIISSQNNVHPGRKIDDETWSDARVLSLRELLILSSFPPDTELPQDVSDTSIRQLIGEGIPPKMIKKILEGLNNA